MSCSKFEKKVKAKLKTIYYFLIWLVQSYHDSERYKIFDQRLVLDSNPNSERNRNDPSKVEEIVANIKRHNELQPILNEDRFGPLEPDSVVIVVQVHTRIDYLQHLIVSLSQAKDISSTLLIFSHDHYDENINDLIRKIEFCKVLQVIQVIHNSRFTRKRNRSARNLKSEMWSQF